MASANTSLPANPSPHTETAKYREENLADKLKQDSDNGYEILGSLSDTILEGIKDLDEKVKNEGFAFAAAWMDLEIIILSKVNK